MSMNVSLMLHRQLTDTERRFRKSCEQVIVLNHHVEEATKRFHDADRADNKISRYNIRLRLSVLEGVRNMYYEYAAKMASDIVDLQRRIMDVIDHRGFHASGSADFLDDIDDDSDSDLSELAFGASALSDFEGSTDSECELC